MFGHQKTLTFTMLMEAAAAHALTEEKMNSFPELDQKAGHNSQSTKTEQHRYDSRADRPHQPYR